MSNDKAEELRMEKGTNYKHKFNSSFQVIYTYSDDGKNDRKFKLVRTQLLVGQVGQELLCGLINHSERLKQTCVKRCNRKKNKSD